MKCWGCEAIVSAKSIRCRACAAKARKPRGANKTKGNGWGRNNQSATSYIQRLEHLYGKSL